MRRLRRRGQHQIRRRASALDALGGVAPGRVLDAPCGNGILTRALEAAGWQAWTCDIDPEVAGRGDGTRFAVVDLDRALPYADGFFDAVVSVEGVEHLLAPAHCIAEFARVLRPGGRLVLTTPNVNGVQSRYHYFVSGRFAGFRTLTRRALESRDRHVGWHVTVPYLPTLFFAMRRAGLEVDAVTATTAATDWLWSPLAAPMWLLARKTPPGSPARILGEWRLLVGRSVVVSAVKRAIRGSG